MAQQTSPTRPGRVDRPASSDTDVAVAKMLGKQEEPSQGWANRLDLSPGWLDLSSQIRDLVSLARISRLVREDLLRQQSKDGQFDGYLTFQLTDSQVKTFTWLTNELEHIGGLAEDACDDFENYLAEQCPGVWERKAQEGRP